jgi:translocation and assembly module TamB
VAGSDRPNARDSSPDDFPLIPKAPRIPSAGAGGSSVSPPSPTEDGYSLRPPPTGVESSYSLRPPGDGGPSARPRRQRSVRPTPRAGLAPSSVPASRRFTNVSRILSLILCFLFAIVGAVPILAGVLVRTEGVRVWAAEKTSRLIEDQLGARATYEIHVEPWPLSLALENVVVEGDDDAGPFLRVERASVRPRIFSLLGGKLDAGDVEITGARARVVVRDGELKSFQPKLPEKESEDTGPPRPPFESLSITDADVDLDLEGVLARIHEVDVDLGIESDGAVEVALRAGGATMTRKRAWPGRPDEDAVDEDRLCKLETRLRYEPDGEVLLVRRLLLEAAADFDPDIGTRPACDLVPGDWRRVAVGAGALRIPVGALAASGEIPPIEGRVSATVPASIIHRFLDFPHATGTASLDLDIKHEPGSRFPTAAGRVQAAMVGIDGKVFSDVFEGRLTWKNERLLVDEARAVWGDGTFLIHDVVISPFEPGITLEAREIGADGVTIQGLLRDLGAHPQSHVGWDIARVDIPKFGGTLDPLALSGDLVARTKDFGVYDRPPHREGRRRMVSVDRGDVTGKLVIGPTAVTLQGMHLRTPKSEVFTSVKLGYKNDFGIDVGKGSKVDLGELSPLVAVDIGGVVDVEAHGTGTFEMPRVEGTIAAKEFSIGGFDAGNIRHAKVVFMPLWLDFADVELEKNQSYLVAPRLKVAFDAGADVLVDADVEALKAPYLQIADFLDVFHFSSDPRFSGLAGTVIGGGRVHYALGGPEDKCGGGALEIRAKTRLEKPHVFGETFDSGDLDVRFVYDDQAAGDAGMEVDVASASLRDDKGSIVGQLQVKRGGSLRGSLVGSGLSLDRLEGLGSAASYLDGEAHALATLGGTVSKPEARLDVSLGPLRLGARRLPPSRFFVDVESDTSNDRVGTTRCGHPISRPFDRATYDKDLPSGQFRLNGQIAGGQIRLEDLTISRQRSAVVRGRVSLSSLDLGTVLGGAVGVAAMSQLPEGSLSAQIDIKHLESGRLEATEAQMELFDLELARGGRKVELDEASDPLVLSRGTLVMPRLAMTIVDKSGLKVGFSAEGRIADIVSNPTVDAELAIAPFDLSKLRGDIEGLDRLEGTLSGDLAVKGPLMRPLLTGGAKLRGGGLAFSSPAVAVDDIEVDVAVGGGELRVTRATAKIGAGTVDVTGRIPIVGLGFGAGSATITARGVKVPVDDGIEIVADADLEGSIKPSLKGEANLPELRGTVRLVSFSYARPIGLSIDLGAVSRNLGRAEIETIDPDGDYLKFDINVVSQRPLAVRNDLADLRLEVVDPGIRIAGTNQRYGARGSLRLLSDSKLQLRAHEFDVQEGFIRFDNPNRVEALVDVRATTEIRRYAAAQDPGADTTGGSATGGEWDVGIHAHGSTDDLKLDLTSDPPLSQDDIVLLLTVGMTRAELDRSLLSSIGETVGLEALGALTGADKAVKSVVPIDYFHFGSGYSSRTGKTEPNVTVGKRITDDVRASVTTTLTERDVGANVEWRLRKGLSLQANYDNTNDIGSIIGNLGADLRWRLEFE